VTTKIRSLTTGETVMELYIGVDFHPHQQTVAWCDFSTGEIKTLDLLHNTKQIKEFYSSISPSTIGVEASTNAIWFEKLMHETGHKILVGDPTKIRSRARSRHKSDKRDAELILDLLLKNEFPAIWRRSTESNQVLEILKLRLNLVSQRTQTYNRLQALAHNFGLPKGKMRSLIFQALLKNAEADETQQLHRSQLFSLLASLNERIRELEIWLENRADSNRQVVLLRSQRGVGYMSALATVHTLGDVSRFTRLGKQVAAFAGLDPLEKSSAGKTRFGGISKKGSSMLRYLLGQAANIAARYDGKLKSFHKKLANKKPKSVVKTAVSRKLLVKLAIMLRDNISADEFDKRGRKVGNARI
jgi:transposase